MKIPKILHFIWVGPNPIPKHIANYVYRWRDMYPDWEILLWNDNNLPPMMNQEIYDKVDTYAGKSDVLRYELLNRYGGVYVDMDYYPLKDITPLIEDVDFFCNRDDENWKAPGDQIFCPHYLNPALMGCVPGHPLIRKLVNHLPEWVDNIFENPGPCNETGPTYVSVKLKDDDFTVFPVETFNGEYARHDYLGSWAKKIGEE